MNDTTTVNQAVENLRIDCRTENFNPCTTKMAGYLHGLMKEFCNIPKQYQYSVLETIFGCEILTFSQLTFHTCNTLINLLQGNDDVRALFYTIGKSIKNSTSSSDPIIPGQYKDYLYSCGESDVEYFF